MIQCSGFQNHGNVIYVVCRAGPADVAYDRGGRPDGDIKVNVLFMLHVNINIVGVCTWRHSIPAELPVIEVNTILYLM